MPKQQRVDTSSNPSESSENMSEESPSNYDASLIDINPHDFQEQKPEQAHTSSVENYRKAAEENTSWKPLSLEEKIPDPLIKAPTETKSSAPTKTPTPTASEATSNKESNVPGFIDTWENWLHKNRSSSSQQNVKKSVIDRFIEKSPKISRGNKKESEFKIAQKDQNISHLMTETLANLYLKQKAYPKALEAYETLQQKHPEKAEYFQEKIDSVKKEIEK